MHANNSVKRVVWHRQVSDIHVHISRLRVVSSVIRQVPCVGEYSKERLFRSEMQQPHRLAEQIGAVLEEKHQEPVPFDGTTSRTKGVVTDRTSVRQELAVTGSAAWTLHGPSQVENRL